MKQLSPSLWRVIRFPKPPSAGFVPHWQRQLRALNIRAQSNQMETNLRIHISAAPQTSFRGFSHGAPPASATRRRGKPDPAPRCKSPGLCTRTTRWNTFLRVYMRVNQPAARAWKDLHDRIAQASHPRFLHGNLFLEHSRAWPLTLGRQRDGVGVSQAQAGLLGMYECRAANMG